MIDLVGAIGSGMLALCGVPQAVQCVRQGHARGLSWAFLALWCGGEVLALWYVLARHSDWILAANYFANMVSLMIILGYKIHPTPVKARRAKIRAVK